MRNILFLIVLSIATTSNAAWFGKAKPSADKEGNCVAEVIKENARLFGELEAMDKIATLAETQSKSSVKETQKLGAASFKDLAAKTKSTRAAIKKFGDSFEGNCKALTGKKVSTLVIKDIVTSFDKLAEGYDKMAESWLKPIAKAK